MKRKIIWVGQGCWIADSIIWFAEHDIDVTVVNTKINLRCFEMNVPYFKEMGYKVLSDSPRDIKSVCEQLDKNTIIIGGGNFPGMVASIESGDKFRERALEELDVLYKITKYNHDNKCGAKSIRYFNGDTGFGTTEMIDLFTKKTKYVDIFMFDNELLRDYVIYNIPNIKNKETLIGWLETPLERFVIHNKSSIRRRIISLGRSLCSQDLSKMDFFNKTTFYPVNKNKLSWFERKRWKFFGKPYSYNLAGQAPNLESLYKSRKKFIKFEGKTAFGLSHIYDTFDNSVKEFEKNPEAFFSLDAQTTFFTPTSPKEKFYAFLNNPNKEACYLMYGIIPMIPHAENSYYKYMVDNKMAVLIEKPEDVKRFLKMPRREIQKYRDNIYANRKIFTFDTVGEMILKEFHK